MAVLTKVNKKKKAPVHIRHQNTRNPIVGVHNIQQKSINHILFSKGIKTKSSTEQPDSIPNLEMNRLGDAHMVSSDLGKETIRKSIALQNQNEISPISASNKRVSLKSRLGYYSEKSGWFTTIEGNVHTRTIDEWKEFLKSDASSEAGGEELMSFMALCLRRKVVPDKWDPYNKIYGYKGKWPSNDDAIKLMIALMTTGKGIDFDEDHAVVIGISDFPIYGNTLLGKFSEKFASQAIHEMSKGGKSLGSEHAGTVKSYVEEADSSWGRSDAGPGLIEGSLGTAIAAATAFLSMGSDAYLNSLDDPESIRKKKQNKLQNTIVVSNSAYTIRGAIAAFRARKARQAAIMSALTKSAFAVLKVFTAGLASVGEDLIKRAINDGTNELAKHLTVAYAKKDEKDHAQEQIEGFSNAVDKEVNTLLSSGTAEEVRKVDSVAPMALKSSFSTPLKKNI